MSVMGAILAIRVQVTGATSVNSTLANVKRTIQDTGQSVRDTTDDLRTSTVAAAAWGTALLRAGIGIGGSAISAYEDVEKTRRSFVALIGEVQGNKFAEWLQDYSTTANASTDALRRAAREYLSATQDVGRVRQVITGLENLSAIGKTNAELKRTAEIIADIQSGGTFGKGSYNRLVRVGVPLPAVAKELGVKNLRDAIGQDGGKVADAVIRALNGLDKNTPLLLQRAANEAEHLQKALVPTGRLLELVFTPVVWLGGQAISIFELLNKYTFGFAGALLSVGIASAGVAKLLPILKEAWILSKAIFSVEAIQGFFAFFPKIITALRTILSIETLLTVVEGVRAAIATAWAFAMANPGAVIAAAILAGVGLAVAAGAFGGGSDSSSNPSGNQASRGGSKRSSFDNFMYGQVGRLAGA